MQKGFNIVNYTDIPFKRELREIKVSEFFGHKDSGALLAEYSIECKIAGLPTPDPHIETYEVMEECGYAHILGAFEGDDMTGFVVVLISFNPHYSTLIGAIESIFVAKNKRNGGAGLDLINKAKSLAKEKGASGLFISAPVNSVFTKVMSGMGARNTNNVFFWGFNE